MVEQTLWLLPTFIISNRVYTRITFLFVFLMKQDFLESGFSLFDFPEKLCLVAFLRKSTFRSKAFPKFYYGWNVLGMALTILRPCHSDEWLIFTIAMARRHTFSIVKLRSIEHSIRRQGMFDEGKEIGENPHLSLLLLPLSLVLLYVEWKTHRETECFTSPHHLSFPWEPRHTISNRGLLLDRNSS